MKLVNTTVDPENPDYLMLIAELNYELGSLTGDTGESSFSTENYDPSRDSIIIVIYDNIPVGTGSIRFVNDDICEIKRMYSKKKGVGKYLVCDYSPPQSRGEASNFLGSN